MIKTYFLSSLWYLKGLKGLLYRPCLCLLGFIFFTITVQAAPHKKLPILDRMIASVEGEALTESELNRQTQLLMVRLNQTDTALPPLSELRKQLLERMILEKLQLQLAKQQGIEVTDADLNKAIHDIASRDGLSVYQMQQFLEEQGISAAQFKETIKTEMILSELQRKEVGQHIVISKTEVENFLTSPAGQDQSGVEYRLGHILISFPEDPSQEQTMKLKDRAETMVKELRAGANFAKTAIAKSGDQQALNGGDLGWRKIASIPSTFVKIVPSLRVGEIHGPIRDNSGFHIITLLDKRNTEITSGKKSSEAMRNKAFEILYQRKFDESLLAWLRNLRADSKIEVYLDEP